MPPMELAPEIERMTEKRRKPPGFSDKPELRNGEPGVLFWIALVAIAALLLFLTAAGCVAPEAIRHAKDQQAANKGHANDKALSAEARAIGQANYDAWSVQLYILDDQELPEDVAARRAERKKERKDDR